MIGCADKLALFSKGMNDGTSVRSHSRPVKQSKIASQRQYRVKEGDGFQELRDIICSLTGIPPQTRRDILTKAAELLKQVSKGDLSSQNGLLPALESPQASLCEFDCEPLTSPNNTWANANATWTINSSSMSYSSVTSSLPERYSHPQAEIDYVESGDYWNVIQQTPSQFRQYSSQPQRKDLSLIHSNIDEVSFYVDKAGVN